MKTKSDNVPKLLVTGHVEGQSAEVELMTALEGENMEDLWRT